MNESWQ